MRFLATCIVGFCGNFRLRHANYLAGKFEALSKEHVVLAEATAGSMEEVVDFLNERDQERAADFRKKRQEGHEGGIRLNPGLQSGLPHEPLPLEAFFCAALNLLLDPSCQGEEPLGVMAKDELLLLLEEVQQSPVFLELVLKGCNYRVNSEVHE